jgi:hypothetical protein
MSTFEHAARAFRPSPRTPRGRRLRTGIALALMALVLQTGVPYLHQWLTGGHAAVEQVFAPAHDGGVARSDDRCDDGHAACATCRVLAQSRFFATSGSASLRSTAVSFSRPEALADFAGAPRRATHAPRSPPLSA